jgi:hypothetical protein
MFENNTYYVQKEMERRTSEMLAAAEHNRLVKLARRSATSDSNSSTLNSSQKGTAWRARLWQVTSHWFKPANT